MGTTDSLVWATSAERTVRWRINVAGWLIGALFVGLSYRLFEKSVLDHPGYVALASNQHTVRQDLPGQRGRIYARDQLIGRFPIATNEWRYDVSVIPNRVTDPDRLARQLHDLLDLDEETLRDALSSKRAYLPPLKRRVDRATAERVRALNDRAIQITSVSARTYPERTLASQLLGFVNFDDVGTYGVEARYDDALRGKSGSRLGQRDSFGRLVSITGTVNPEPGSDLGLTIDRTIQFIAERALEQALATYGAGGGSIVVTDPSSGAILALANQPSFDPNQFNTVPESELARFRNDTISTVYEPGSVFKPIVMATALDAGVVTPETAETFSNQVTVQGYEIHTALDKAYGRETMTQILENSDNVGMVWVAGHLEFDALRSALTRFGFGIPTGIDLPGETTGSVLPLGEWRDIHRATVAFGQGVSMTPLQLAAAWGALLNGGHLMKPYVVDRILRSNGEEVVTKPTVVRDVIRSETSDTIRSMLESVVENGQSKKARIDGYSVGGKTGTAQIPNPDGGYYEDQWNHSFMGFFPVSQPRYLVLVKLDRPTASKYADGTALPTFVDVARSIIAATSLLPDR
jgi:cell division protein FtsI/penicillin-binding protein 2